MRRSLKELNELAKALDAEIEQAKKAERKKAFKRIREIMKEHDIYVVSIKKSKKG